MILHMWGWDWVVVGTKPNNYKRKAENLMCFTELARGGGGGIPTVKLQSQMSGCGQELSTNQARPWHERSKSVLQAQVRKLTRKNANHPRG